MALISDFNPRMSNRISNRRGGLSTVPSSKSQAPSSREIPSSKLQRLTLAGFGVWNLVLLWSLDVEAWSFDGPLLCLISTFLRQKLFVRQALPVHHPLGNAIVMGVYRYIIRSRQVQ